MRGLGGKLALALIGVLLALPVGAATAQQGPSGHSRVGALFVLRHPAGLGQFVRQVSNPRSPHYREYASVQALVKRFGAPTKHRRGVLAWVERHGIRGRVDRTHTFITASVPRARLGLFRAGSEAREAAGTARVPAPLRGAVSAVALDTTQPKFHDAAAHLDPARVDALHLPPDHGSFLPRTGTPSGCAEGLHVGEPEPYSAFTPNQYLAAYGHSALQARGLRGQGLRAAVVEIDGFERSNLEAFGACFGIRIPPTPVHTVGIPEQLRPGDETTLDLEILSAAAPAMKAIDVYEGNSSTAGILESLSSALGRPGRRPSVISMSLGTCEPGLEGQTAAARATNNVLAVAAGAGISTFVSAGDQGSSACQGGEFLLPIVSTNFAASSPYATAVGGTNLTLSPANQLVDQVAWNDAPAQASGTGGGTSLLWRRPWYQHGRAFAQKSPTRIVPDVAALADLIPGYAIYCTNSECDPHPHGWTSIGGTSAATPLTAGGVLLTNQLLRRRGQPPLGLVNPLLYDLGRGRAAGAVLSDVAGGDNDLGVMIPRSLGGEQPLGCCYGHPGYDHVTGWGSIAFPAFARRALRAGRR